MTSTVRSTAAATPAATPRRRRGRGDDGTALIEAAFVIPLIVVIVFGIIEVGYLFRSGAAVSNATRAGARSAAQTYAVSMNDSTSGRTAKQLATANTIRAAVEEELKSRGATDTPQLLWIYKANASGHPGPNSQTDFSSCPASSCFVYTWSGTTFGSSPSGGWSQPDACGSTIDSIGVYLKVGHEPLAAPASLSVRTVEQYSVMRLEPRIDCTTTEGPF